MEVSDQLHASVALPRGKAPWYLQNGNLGYQSRSGRHQEPVPGIETSRLACRHTDISVLSTVYTREVGKFADEATLVDIANIVTIYLFILFLLLF
jgi:hypothetical protein